MELSKELPIFSIINKYIETSDNKYELEIEFKKEEGYFTENDFNNFTNFMRSHGYQENIEQEYLECRNDNDYMVITGMANIVKFCVSNSYNTSKTSWNTSKTIVTDTIDDLFDLNIQFSLKNNIKIFKPDNWDDIMKKFVIKKQISYDADNVKFISYMYKETDDENYSLKRVNIMKLRQNYGFKVVFKNDLQLNQDLILKTIIKSLQAINMSSMLLTKIQQKQILDEYYNLVKNDIEISYYNKKANDIPLITPKPITLERINMIDPKEYGAVSILSEYTVTEKADGERLLMFVNNTGNVYTINNTYVVENTGIQMPPTFYNSIIDGEFIKCNKRKDNANKDLFAAFDMYYSGGKNITNLPLINDKECRNNYMIKFAKQFPTNKGHVEFIAKEHKYSQNIFEDTKQILTNANTYPYEIDGLIFTPAKLALYSYYTNNPVKLTDNMKWDRVFKWKPEEQNTIDFLVTIDKTITKNGLKYKQAKLYVGYNASQWEDIDIEKGLKLRYDKEYAKENRKSYQSFVPVLFRPTVFYTPGVEYSHIKINSKGELRAENNDLIDTNSIVEFKYINDPTIPVSERWRPIRVRDDKTRIFRKGILSKTANELGVALNIWRSIHIPVTTSMIMGNEPVFNKELSDNMSDRLLESDDVYYSRNIPRDYLQSVHMLNFHNQGIKKYLYNKPTKKGSLLELCCGEAGDLNRWIESGYTFILGIDFVKKNIYNPKSGCYSRMLKRRNQYVRNINPTNKVYFPDMVFAAGDCSASIKNGEASKVINDTQSEKILQIVMNRQSSVNKHIKYIAGKGKDGFDAVSCMFAIHYFFESEDKLDGFLKNVSDNLKTKGVFFCTFMNGGVVEKAINDNGGDMIEGRKFKEDYTNGMPLWAVIRRYNKDQETLYGKKIDVYIENTQKLIPEYMVSFQLLVKKASDYGLQLLETEMFEESFNKLKNKIPENEDEYTHLDQDILNLDKDDIQKQFSFLNQWTIFQKI